jgi:hypothetical protein
MRILINTPELNLFHFLNVNPAKKNICDYKKKGFSQAMSIEFDGIMKIRGSQLWDALAKKCGELVRLFSHIHIGTAFPGKLVDGITPYYIYVGFHPTNEEYNEKTRNASLAWTATLADKYNSGVLDEFAKLASEMIVGPIAEFLRHTEDQNAMLCDKWRVSDTTDFVLEVTHPIAFVDSCLRHEIGLFEDGLHTENSLMFFDKSHTGYIAKTVGDLNFGDLLANGLQDIKAVYPNYRTVIMTFIFKAINNLHPNAKRNLFLSQDQIQTLQGPDQRVLFGGTHFSGVYVYSLKLDPQSNVTYHCFSNVHGTYTSELPLIATREIVEAQETAKKWSDVKTELFILRASEESHAKIISDTKNELEKTLVINSKLTEESEEQKKQLDAIAAENGALKEKSEEQIRQLDATTSENKELKEKSEEQVRQLDVTTSENKALKEKSEEQVRQLDVTTSENKALKEKSEEQVRQLDVITSENKALMEKFEEQRKQLDVTTSENKALKEKSEEQVRQLDASAAENGALKEKSEGQVKQLDVITSENKALMEKFEEQRKQLDVTTSENKALMEKFEEQRKQLYATTAENKALATEAAVWAKKDLDIETLKSGALDQEKTIEKQASLIKELEKSKNDQLKKIKKIAEKTRTGASSAVKSPPTGFLAKETLVINITPMLHYIRAMSANDLRNMFIDSVELNELADTLNRCAPCELVEQIDSTASVLPAETQKLTLMRVFTMLQDLQEIMNTNLSQGVHATESVKGICDKIQEALGVFRTKEYARLFASRIAIRQIRAEQIIRKMMYTLLARQGGVGRDSVREISKILLASKSAITDTESVDVLKMIVGNV